MDYAVLTGIVLVAGVVFAVVAQWRDWRPPLAVAILVGVAVRLLIMYTSAIDSWQPVDFVESFKPAGEAVLRGQDPVLASEGGWHFLPTIPYVYGILLWLGIPWEYAGRLVTVVADIALIPLVAKLAGGPKASLRALQYALNPLAVLIASVHGQVEPVALVFGVAAFVVARGPGDPERPGLVTDVVAKVRAGVAAYGVRASVPRVIGRGGMLHRALLPGPDDRAHLKRGLLAGALMGLALCAKSWPIWLIPGFLLLLPNLRSRIAALFTTGLVPIFFLVTLPIFAGTSIKQLPAVIDTIRDIRPIVGEWGWTPWFTEGSWDLRPELASFGTNLIYACVVLVILWWRRADPIDMTTAILLIFMVVTPRLGAQYLLWFMPFLVARPTRFAWPAIIGCCVWAGYGYLVMTQFDVNGWWLQHSYWSRASIVLLPILLLAMPWGRHIAAAPAPKASLSRQVTGIGAATR
ncbi:unnamed protein product [[Actinomadura] parvosata subsp. kistnae]|uniref:DUF2029 domain-containing protein n=1 Tax=[Actinomadura] parvosata subsp. kistnae TaxID=1909395 RepID=A0A1V0A708_9ACTN|nr:hypothetical protein [Nonomuraea sp. ATCC 55076]AQZ65997.1 hypothetical protein BKM31_35120 [Nonomuraea sp. ATCC 55076]SPL97466.1 unnamed protein product [Actinomadura parvosata subsp. kistnae]